MGAITELCSIGEAAVKTAHAGHDMLLVCHQMKAQREVYEALVEAYKSGKLPANELEESAARVQFLKAKRTGAICSLPATAARADQKRTFGRANSRPRNLRCIVRHGAS